MNKTDAKIETIRKRYLKSLFRLSFKREKQSLNGAIATKKEKMCSKP